MAPRSQGTRGLPGRGVRRLLLRFYPADFRRKFAPDWLRFLALQRREERYARRGLGAVRFWRDVIADVAVSGFQLRWAWAPFARMSLVTPGTGSTGGAGSRPPGTGNAKGRTSAFGAVPQDLRYAVRTLAKSPAFTAVVVFSLALGIGATSTIFSVLNPVVLRPLPFEDPARLVRAYLNSAEQPDARRRPAHSTLLAWREHSTSLEQLESQWAATELEKYPGVDGAEHIGVQEVSLGYFRVLGVAPILGRHFVAEDVPPGPAGSAGASGGGGVIISDGLWQRRFGGDPKVLGQTLGSDVVVGVMPAGFQVWPWNTTDIWKSLDDELSQGGPVGRLKPGVTMEQARAELEAIALGLDDSVLSADSGWRLQLMSLHETGTLFVTWSNLYLLMGVAVFVLLIACSNVASLLMGRATNRHREVTTRAALGAGRLRLIRQMLTESIVLALLGGVLGVLFTRVGIRLFVVLAPDWYESPLAEIRIDGMVLGFTLGLSLLTVLFFGMAPALRASKPDLTRFLKQGGRASGGGSRRLAHRLLAGSQIALTFVLLVGAALMINSLVRLVTFDRGFDPERLLTARLDLESERYWPQKEKDGRQIAVLSPEVDIFYRETLDQLRALRGVETAEVATVDNRIFTRLPGPALRLTPDSLWGEYREASPGFFAVMGIPLLKGRSFAESDTESSLWVAVINETLARLYFPDEDPIGRILQAGQDDPREIVGVVGDYEARSLKREQRPGIYVPHTQHRTEFTRPAKARLLANRQLILETSLDPLSLAADLRRIVADIDPGAAVYDIETMQASLDRTVAPERFWVRTLGIFATLALLLSVVGIYGVVASAVAQRTHEIGVRMALGAQRTDVLRMVVRQGMVMTVGGVTVGVLGALAATRLLASQLYEIEPTDPATFTAVAVLLVGIALLATYVPARGATRVDPINTMRSE